MTCRYRMETAWLCFGLALCFASPSAAPAQVKKPTRMASEKALGELTLDQVDFKKRNFWISPDSKHYAFLTEKEVIVDGKKFEAEGGTQTGKGKIFSFSPDSQHFVYVMRDKEGKEFVHLDGKPIGIGHNFVAAPPVFSPDSQHIAYTCRRYVGGGTKYFLVINEKDRETYEEGTTWNIAFSGDGKRVILGVEKEGKYLMREVPVDPAEKTIEHAHRPANLQLNAVRGGGGQIGYLAKDAEGKTFFYYDGKEMGKGFKEVNVRNIELSDDGKEVAILGEIASFRDAVWHQGKMGPEHRGIEEGTLAISRDGSHVGYAVEEFSKAHAIIDGKQGKEYREVAGITFSPDGKRYAYRANTGSTFALVVDGVEGPGYNGMGLPYFSPDGKLVVVAASQGESQFILVNGQPSLNGAPQKAYKKVTPAAFSKTGKRIIYLGEVGGKNMLIDNGAALESYDGAVEQFYLSEDESLLAYIAAVGEEEMVLINGAPGNKYETIMTMGGGSIVFEGNGGAHYLAIKEGKILLVEEKLGE